MPALRPRVAELPRDRPTDGVFGVQLRLLGYAAAVGVAVRGRGSELHHRGASHRVELLMEVPLALALLIMVMGFFGSFACMAVIVYCTLNWLKQED